MASVVESSAAEPVRLRQLAIVGGGFMGGALAEGLLDAGWHRESIIVAERREDRRQSLRDLLRIHTTEDARAAVEQARAVVFAVKPQDIRHTLESVAPAYSSDKLAISICAGIPIATFEAVLGHVPVVRTMPNTPAAVGLGATAIARGQYADNSHLTQALNILSAVGKVVLVDESQIDAVTAVSGTGPAYFFYLAEALIDVAQQEGLSREQAYVLVYQTIVGAAQLLLHDPAEPGELLARVTSPNGTTQAAISYLQERGWKDMFQEAVRVARRRSEELGTA